ncbi:hypothetical protein EJ04DRAFT_569299 [Polyplosphaeria fusca]|uniref:Uncharacterized protein n=1 Tax=Polyplosphaeria fusca TaxID=682080 RepID=A0A9P4QLR7_9PLEO|nr:hypothetical protein EJ04DRAFT_569299 [Polyplosphaeria fusca]
MVRPIAAYFALLGLVVSTIFSLLALVANVRGWHSSEQFAVTVTNERATIAIIIQVISHSLGLLQICALCAIVSLSFQQHASSSPFSLNALRLMNSAFSLRFDWNLPWYFLLPLGLFISFSLVPAAIWSGTLTPTVVPNNITVPFSIPEISTVVLDENKLFGDLSSGDDGGCPWISGQTVDNKTQIGTFHTCLSRLSLLGSASSSSSIQDIPGREEDKAHVHAKIDRSGFSFIGRSYSAGAAVGLADMPEIMTPLAYTYAETGFYADVQCIFNTSSAYRLEKFDTTDNIVEVYNAIGKGTFPEGLNANWGTKANNNESDVAYQAHHFGYLAVDIFDWASAYNNNRTSYFAMAAVADACDGADINTCGYGFAKLHQMQCTVDFTARNFSVYVDAVGRTITVTPHETVEWPSYTDALLEELSAEHSQIGSNDGAFGGSQLGRALLSNMEILQAYRNESTPSNETKLQSVSDFVADLMDNTLISYSQSRFFGSRGKGLERRVVDANVARNVVVYGEKKFIVAAACINFLILVVFFVEAIRTRFWGHLCNLDLLDMASVAVGGSYGGTKLAAQVQNMGSSTILLPGSRPSARDFTGAVMVRLKNINGAMSAIEPADRPGTNFEERELLTKRSLSAESIFRRSNNTAADVETSKVI